MTRDRKLINHIGDKYIVAIDTDNDKDRKLILIPEEQKDNLKERATQFGNYLKNIKRRSFIAIALEHYTNGVCQNREVIFCYDSTIP